MVFTFLVATLYGCLLSALPISPTIGSFAAWSGQQVYDGNVSLALHSTITPLIECIGDESTPRKTPCVLQEAKQGHVFVDHAFESASFDILNQVHELADILFSDSVREPQIPFTTSPIKDLKKKFYRFRMLLDTTQSTAIHHQSSISYRIAKKTMCEWFQERIGRPIMLRPVKNWIFKHLITSNFITSMGFARHLNIIHQDHEAFEVERENVHTWMDSRYGCAGISASTGQLQTLRDALAVHEREVVQLVLKKLDTSQRVFLENGELEMAERLLLRVAKGYLRILLYVY